MPDDMNWDDVLAALPPEPSQRGFHLLLHTQNQAMTPSQRRVARQLMVQAAQELRLKMGLMLPSGVAEVSLSVTDPHRGASNIDLSECSDGDAS